MPHNSPALDERLKAQNARSLPEKTESSEEGRAILIPLTQGLFAKIDACDFERISKHKWYAAKLGRRKTPYAVRGDYSLGRKNKRAIFLHHAIADSAGPVDHRNGDTLDNRAKNLRPCTHQQNSFNKINTTKRAEIKSKYKGVSWHKRIRKWQACISVSGKRKCLGYFQEEEKAAESYNLSAASLFGEFASLNCVETKKMPSPIDCLCNH